MKENNAPELRNIPPFAGLPGPARQYLQSRLRRYDFTPGDSIVEPGKRGAFFALVGRGVVIIQEMNGETQTLMAGCMFGEGMLRFGVPSSFSARAQTDTSLWVLKRADWLAAKDFPVSSSEKPSHPAQKNQPLFPRWVVSLIITIIFLVVFTFMLGTPLLNFTHETITKVALEADRLDLAQEYIELALLVQPDSARLYDYLGYLLYLQGKPVQSRVILERAINLDESLASVHNNLGVILLEQGEVSEAILQLEDAVLLDPTSSDSYLNLGNAFLKSYDYKSALANYQKAYEIDPSQIEARALWASVAFDMGQTFAAQEVWRDILTDNPNHSIANQGIGVLEALDQNYEDALPYLQTAILDMPDDATTHYYLGITWQALGNTNESIAEFEAVLALSKDTELLQRTKKQLKQLQD